VLAYKIIRKILLKDKFQLIHKREGKVIGEEILQESEKDSFSILPSFRGTKPTVSSYFL